MSSFLPLNKPMPDEAYLAKRYNENSCGIFRTPTDVTAGSDVGLVGPLASSYSLPLRVENALAEMKSSGACATFGSLGFVRRAHALMFPILGSTPSPMQHEVLRNFFKSILSPKDRGAIPSTLAVSIGTAARKPTTSGPRHRMVALVVRARVGSQRDPDADSRTDDGRMRFRTALTR